MKFKAYQQDVYGYITKDSVSFDLYIKIDQVISLYPTKSYDGKHITIIECGSKQNYYVSGKVTNIVRDIEKRLNKNRVQKSNRIEK